MQPSPIRDLIVGLFVLAGLAALAYLSIQVGGLSYKGPGGLELIASFDEIGGLATRAPVAISGVKVGQVVAHRARSRRCARASRSTSIRRSSCRSTPERRSAPRACSATSSSRSSRAREEELLKSGEEIAFTDPALSLERLIGKFVNNAGLDDTEKKDGEKK